MFWGIYREGYSTFKFGITFDVYELEILLDIPYNHAEHDQILRQNIRQEDEFGCGAACLAQVCGITYRTAVELLGIDKARSQGFYGRELEAGLRHFGKSYQFRYLKPRLRRHIYNPGVIVFICRSKRYPFGHYLVYTNCGWSDSWINMQHCTDVQQSTAGVRKRLPGRAQYALFPDSLELL